MSMGAGEAVGLAIGVVGLVAAFDGAIKGIILISDFVGKDDQGLPDLVLAYHVERQRLENWGSHYNIHAKNAKDCRLARVSQDNKDSIYNILIRIEKLNQSLREIANKHGADADAALLSADSRGSPSQAGDDNPFNLSPKDIAALQPKQSTNLMPQGRIKSKFRFLVNNKAKFDDIIKKLEYYNNSLVRLMEPSAQTAFQSTLPGPVLALLTSPDILKRLGDLDKLQGSNVAHVAQLKAIEASFATSSPIKILEESDMAFSKQESSDGARVYAIYKRTDRVWVEWRVGRNGLGDSQAASFKRSTELLSCKLSATSAKLLHTAECIGLMTDQTNSCRLGLVYRAPSTSKPQTLLSLVADPAQEPALGDKFHLARYLTSSITGLHSANWIHRAFRSDNLLCFGSLPDSLVQPVVSGFQSSREITMESIGTRPTGSGAMDYYYHPDIVNGFNKVMDLYSLGVLLLEIAYWRPLGATMKKSGLTTLKAVHKNFLESIDALPLMVGKIYADVVRRCLECQLAGLDDDEFTCRMISDIVSPLEICQA